MDCRAFCTASAYPIKALFEYFKKANTHVALYRDVIHYRISNDEIRDIFYFPYGATVFWGLSLEECQSHLEGIKQFEEKPNEEIDTDEFTFIFGGVPKIVEDEIILPDRDVLSRLAISHGLAQSVKLGTFELAIRKTFNKTKHIPEDLAKQGESLCLAKRLGKKWANSSLNATPLICMPTCWIHLNFSGNILN